MAISTKSAFPFWDRFSQFALVAARQAVAQSGLDFHGPVGIRSAVVVGTGSGGMNTVDEAYQRLYQDGKLRVFPLTVPRLMVSAAASHVTMEFGVRGPGYSVSSAWLFSQSCHRRCVQHDT